MKADAQLDAMHDRLIDLHRQNPREGLGDALLMYIQDPLKPQDEQGRFRVNPILMLLASVLALVFGAFLFFSVVRS
jgi:hypothetical protein